MSKINYKAKVQKCMEDYFLEHRAKLIDIAAFLDRLERTSDFDASNLDFRHKTILQALENLVKLSPGSGTNRAEKMQLAFSDLSSEPLASAAGLKGANGAPCLD